MQIVKNIMMFLISVFLFLVMFSIFGWWIVWIPLGIIVLLLLIRFIADIFWYGRNKGQW
jgi:hypothetical protein